MTDRELIEGIRKGQSEFLQELMKRYNPLVYRILLRFCRLKQDLDDLVQEVWIRVFFKIEKLEKLESFKSWLGNIAYHLGIDYLKKDSKNKERQQDEREFAAEEKEFFDQELHRLIWEEIVKLDKKYQVALTLFFFENLSYEEIAEVTDTKLNTVKSLIKRGKEFLKKQLEQRGLNLWNI